MPITPGCRGRQQCVIARYVRCAGFAFRCYGWMRAPSKKSLRAGVPDKPASKKSSWDRIQRPVDVKGLLDKRSNVNEFLYESPFRHAAHNPYPAGELSCGGRVGRRRAKIAPCKVSPPLCKALHAPGRHGFRLQGAPLLPADPSCAWS